MPVDLGKEYGPLPLGAWIAVVGGGLGIALWSRRTNTGTVTPQVVEDTRKMEGVGDGFSAYTPAVNIGVMTPEPEKDPVTNEEWGRKAINLLIALNYEATIADSAIRKYLEAQPLSPTENALVRIALQKLGSPPIPLPPPQETAPTQTPVKVNPPPVVKPPPAPVPPPRPPMRTVVVTKWPSGRGSLWGIAKEFYGDGNQWRRLFDANRLGVLRPDGSRGMIVNPNLIYAGWVIYVP